MPIGARILTLIDELDGLRASRDDAWQIPRVEGELLYQIALASRAKIIVEVGTSYGFSGLFWGAAAQKNGGVLHTIDISSKKYDSSRETFRRAGLDGVVINHLGDAMQKIATIPGPFDIVFLDGFDKQDSSKYFDQIWPYVAKGGAVITDNTGTHKEELSGYVAYVRSRSDTASTDLPVGNGVEWTLKL